MNIQNIGSENNQHYLSQNLSSLALKTIDLLRDMGMTVGFAESCTGGLLSSEFTKVSGVSDIFLGSVVCYSNPVKENILDVKSETLKNFGAVSAPCAQELSIGVLKKLKVTAAISITGIAGPTGGSKEIPVGTVFISVAGTNLATGQTVTKNYCHQFGPIETGMTTREEIKKMACIASLEHLQKLLKDLK